MKDLSYEQVKASRDLSASPQDQWGGFAGMLCGVEIKSPNRPSNGPPKRPPAAGSFAPEVIAHIPGVANVAADYLSRDREPGTTKTRPAYLPESTAIQLLQRDLSWWRSLPGSPNWSSIGGQISNSMALLGIS